MTIELTLTLTDDDVDDLLDLLNGAVRYDFTQEDRDRIIGELEAVKEATCPECGTVDEWVHDADNVATCADCGYTD